MNNKPISGLLGSQDKVTLKMLLCADTDRILHQRSSQDRSNNILLESLNKTDITSKGVENKDTNSNSISDSKNVSPKSGISRPFEPTYHYNRKSLQPETDRVINITVLGEPRCGKTSLVHRLTSGTFSKKYNPTYGANTTLLYLSYTKCQHCCFRFLDTNDVILDPWMAVTLEERANALHAQYSDYVIIVYDITDHRSFEAAKDWLRLTHGFLKKSARLILVGNKADLDRRRQVHHTALNVSEAPLKA